MPKTLPMATRRARHAADFAATLRRHGLGPLVRETVRTLQINVGKLCNQACHHCHVDAGPKRTEIMPEHVVARLLELLRAAPPELEVVDITGGAPEMVPGFRPLVQAAHASGRRVIDRCNLTILLEPGHEDLAAFLAAHRVHVIASLPCYSPANVDRQRGKGVFGKSIEALRRLQALGYGREGSGLRLDLVYNPLGPTLPPPQAQLEADYKRRLWDDFGIRFDSLLTITNMPIARFADMLVRQGAYERYMSLLVNHFNPQVVHGVMCRSLVSVDWQGRLFDCDFNQMLELPLAAGHPGRRRTIWELDALEELAGLPIATADHCFGCTAGAGSSCGGALA
ncbi:MAG: radical SAM/Cys-rich domain protein [Planctomycetota bacterium]|nr:MAG: radical SAM/Cys-rich domain protein [Planctomycetota bacterium]